MSYICDYIYNILLQDYSSSSGLEFRLSYTGWPRKNATLTINNFKKRENRIKNLYALLRIQFYSQQNDTKIVNFYKGVFFLWLFSEAMSFLRFALGLLSSKVTIYVSKIFHRLAFPGVKCLLLLCKAKPAWIKRNHSLRNFAALQSGGSYSKKFLSTSNVTFDTKGANFEKWHCLIKNWL